MADRSAPSALFGHAPVDGIQASDVEPENAVRGLVSGCGGVGWGAAAHEVEQVEGDPLLAIEIGHRFLHVVALNTTSVEEAGLRVTRLRPRRSSVCMRPPRKRPRCNVALVRKAVTSRVKNYAREKARCGSIEAGTGLSRSKERMCL